MSSILTYVEHLLGAFLVAWWFTNNEIIQALFENLKNLATREEAGNALRFFAVMVYPVVSCEKCMTFILLVFTLSIGINLPNQLVLACLGAFLVANRFYLISYGSNGKADTDS